MSWNRHISLSENLMVQILADAQQPLTLDEIVENILLSEPKAFAGRTPKKSLYSVVYRREKRRTERGQPTLFKTSYRGGATYYSLNNSRGIIE